MTESITVWLDDQIGIAGQYLWLRKSDGTLLNTGGDALTDPDDTGLFSATLNESRTGLGTLRATITGSSDPTDAVAAGWLAESSALVVDDYPQSASGGAGDASQETVQEVLDVVNSIAIGFAGSAPVEPTGISVLGLLNDAVTLLADAIARIDEESYTIGEISEALAGGGGASVFEYLRQLTNSGTGEFTVTITVTDGTNPLQNALVRIIDGGTTYSAITNVSGEAEFQLDAASYVVAIDKSGYRYAGTTLVVDADETASYAMTLNTLVIPSLGQVARRSIPVTVVDRVS
jgi:hypothetical protein